MGTRAATATRKRVPGCEGRVLVPARAGGLCGAGGTLSPGLQPLGTPPLTPRETAHEPHDKHRNPEAEGEGNRQGGGFEDHTRRSFRAGWLLLRWPGDRGDCGDGEPPIYRRGEAVYVAQQVF